MEHGDPSGYHIHPHFYASPAAHHHLNSQPQQASSSASLSFLPNPNPNPSATTGYGNPFHSSATASFSDELWPPGVDRHYDPYASGLAYGGAQTISSQSYPQAAADYYYQPQQQPLPQSTAKPSTYAAVGTGSTIGALETKRRKVIAGGAPADSVRVCTLCNVVCNSEKVFALHLGGEKHSLKASIIPSNMQTPKFSAYMHLTKKTAKPSPKATAAKKASNGLIAFVQSSFCDVCKVDCNSQEVLSNHRLGKKHLKNVRKLQEAIKPKPATEPSNNSTLKAKPSASESLAVIEQPKQSEAAAPEDLEIKKVEVEQLEQSASAAPEEGGETKKLKVEQPKQSAAAAPKEDLETKKLKVAQPNQSAAAARKEDLETKKLNVLRFGAAADAIRECTYCNVVCTSPSAYNSHIVGKRHIARMNKQQKPAAAVS